MSDHPFYEKVKNRLKHPFGRPTSSVNWQGSDAGSSKSPPLLSPSVTNTTISKTLSKSSSTSTPTKNPLPSPSPSSPPAYTPSRDLWSEALDNLSTKDRKSIEQIKASVSPQQPNSKLSDSVPDLVSKAREKQKECEDNSWKFRFQDKEIILRDVAEKTVFWLNKFKDFGDIAVGFDPVHAALPWAGVRFLLQVVTAGQEQMGALLVSSEKVTCLTDRCTIYESLYKPGTIKQETLDPLNSQLVKLYAAILRLLAASHRLFEKGIMARDWHAVWHPEEVSGLLKECEKLEEQVEIEATNCERQRSQDADIIIKSLLEDIINPVIRTDENVGETLEIVSEDEKLRILNWISPVLYNANHDFFKVRRTEGTCEWLLQHKSYRLWQNESTSIILWLHGNVGTGKTYLTSRVIDDILFLFHKYVNNHEGLAFFYFSRADAERQTTESVLRSFVRQLSTILHKENAMQKTLREYYLKTQYNAAKPTIEDCKKYILQFINKYPKTTIILDGLDECEEKERKDLMDILDGLLADASKPVKMFISSRPNDDIKRIFKDRANIEIQATDNEEDIAKFVRKQIAKHDPWVRLPSTLKDDIVKILRDRSKGMFQWTKLQIDQLQKWEEAEQIRRLLDNLPTPEDLKPTYDSIFKEMGPREQEIADRAFQWVMCSRRPLTTNELLLAVDQSEKNEKLKPVEDLTEDMLVKFCHNLLDRDSGFWVPSHASVLEYIVKWRRSRQQANYLVASVCLSLLNDRRIYKPENWILSKSPTEWKQNDKLEFPMNKPGFRELMFYARHHWMIHVQDCGEEGTKGPLPYRLKRFLKSPDKSSHAYQAWYKMVMKDRFKPASSFVADSRFDLTDLEPEAGKAGEGETEDEGESGEEGKAEEEGSMAAFAICAFGLHSTLQYWENSWKKYELRNANGYSQLQLAAIAGSVPICEYLIRRGVNVNEQFQGGGYGSTLAAAAAFGNTKVVELLLGHKAEVNQKLRVGWYGSALAAAAYWGQKDTVQFLIDNEAKANSQLLTGEYGSPLVAAAASGNQEIVELLIEADADVNQPLHVGRYGSALAAAASSGNKDLVEFLIKEGAQVDAQLPTGEFGSALAAAKYKRNKEVIKLLERELGITKTSEDEENL